MDALTSMHARALEDARRHVRHIRADQWDAPTPCTEWDVRDLVAHLTREHLWAVDLAAGRTLAEVGDRYEGDVLGDDPVAAFDAAADAALAALGDEERRARRVHSTMGMLDIDQYLGQLLTDALVHGWDVAVAIGDDARMDPELAEACERMNAGAADELESARSAGVFAAAVEVGAAAGPQERLLAMLGRDPRAG